MSLQFSLFYLLFHLLFIAFIDFTIMCTHAEGQTPKHYYLFALGSALVLAVNTAVKIIIPTPAKLLKSVTQDSEAVKHLETKN